MVGRSNEAKEGCSLIEEAFGVNDNRLSIMDEMFKDVDAEVTVKGEALMFNSSDGD